MPCAFGGDIVQWSSYIPIIVLFLIIFLERRKKNLIAGKRVIENRSAEDKKKMIELAKLFLGKECMIYAFDSSHQFVGTIKEVTDGAILIEKDGKLEAINLNYVIRIREYPVKKNGKKKSVVLD